MIASQPRVRAWGRRSWAATCSGPSAATGPTRSGRAGGATIRHTTIRRSSSLHHPHESITMQGGTVFHFVTDGAEAALERAYEAADRQDVRLAGGASTIQQYLRAGLVDEMHLAYSPLLLGSGERLWSDLDGRQKGMRSPRFRTPAAPCPFCAEGLSHPAITWHPAWARRGTM